MTTTFERRVCRRVDDEALKRLWPTRLPDKELAALLGHHRSVIRRRASQLGLRPRRLVWSEQNAELLK